MAARAAVQGWVPSGISSFLPQTPGSGTALRLESRASLLNAAPRRRPWRFGIGVPTPLKSAAAVRASTSASASLPDFLPEEARLIEEEAAVSLLQRISRLPVQTSLSDAPVESSCVMPRNAGATSMPLMLLHGFDSSCLEWRRAYPELEALGLEPWAVDILGWGFNGAAGAGVKSFSVEAKREHLVQFWRTHMGARRVMLVGASLGGAAAIDLATHHPELVAALVLVDAQGYAEGVGEMAAMPDWLARAGVAVLKSVPLRLYAGTLAYHDRNLATTDAMRVGRLHCLVPGWEDAKLDFMRSGGYTVAQRIPQVEQPALVVWGAQDRILDAANAQKFMEELPNASLEIVDLCGHLPHLEKPHQFAALVKDFHTSLETSLVPVEIEH